MRLIIRLIALCFILSFHVGGFLLFTRGFFPKKLLLPGYGRYFPNHDSEFPDPVFNKLVFIVIDAMRSDFMFGPSSNMPNVHGMIESGYGVPFTAFSTPPTVTLPRIKGLTSGSTPNFLDAILNIAEDDTSSTLSGQDTWLYQLKQQGKSIHMFGDDTWIKLFPGMFDEIDGTASFFVSDFTEVDNNVTRHLDQQLSATGSQPDVLILHYLGLDHIGHKGGPLSPFMPKKQQEMDSIIKRVFDGVEDDTLIVVAGDHGMNEAGNHGGSSSGETSAAMVWLSKKFSSLDLQLSAPVKIADEDFHYYQKIQQADLIPSLAALLNFPIPRNSLGVIPQIFWDLWSGKDLANVLEQNARQLESILSATYTVPESIQVDHLANLSQLERIVLRWSQLEAEEEGFANTENVYDYLKECQSLLSRASSTYNVKDMVCGVLLEVLAAAISTAALMSVDFSKKLKFLSILLSLVYLCTMFASSLVEEEHQFWYWAVTGFLAWIYVISARKGFKSSNNWIVCLAIIRVIRGWNQTGQKYAGAFDMTKFLTTEGNGGYLWALIMAYYSFLFAKTWNGNGGVLKFIASLFTVLASFVFKVNMALANGEYVPSFLQHTVVPQDGDIAQRLVQMARLCFLAVGGFLFYELTEVYLQPNESKRSITKISYLVEVFLATQTRTCNIPLFICFNLLRHYLLKSFASNKVNRRDAAALLVVFILILQHATFFAFGSSNSLASVDLSNAYNGVESYNIFFVGVLTFVSNWIGPLYWSMAGLAMAFESHVEGIQLVRRNDVMSTRIFLPHMFFSIAVIGIMGACIALKDHLFIWTVFSPKLLYAAAWLIVQNGLIDTILTLVMVAALR